MTAPRSGITAYLGRVEYSIRKQRQLANLFAYEFIEHVPDWFGGGRMIAHARATLYMWVLAALMKHPSFAEEKEWRLYLGSIPEDGVKFRAARLGLTPYVEVPLARQLIRNLEVVVGPCGYPGNAAMAVSMLLDKMESSPRVGSSRIPFRDW